MIKISGVTLGNITGGPSSLNLYDLADVSIVSPLDGQCLRYNSTIEEWQNAFVTTTLTGDVTGSGTGSFPTTLATVNASPQSDTFRKITVNGKGLVTATSAVAAIDITTALAYTPVNKAGDTMTGNLILNADPVAALGAATKQYVDTLAAGLNVHMSCVTATTATLASSSSGTITYDNGASGVGATLTTTGSFATIGGYSTTNGNRILVKDEATQANNGIYVRTSATVLTRAADFDDSPDGEIEAGDFTYIINGTLGGTNWVQITPSPITVGSTAIVFTQLSGPGSYVGGTGINVTSNVISNTGVLSATGTANQIAVSASTGAVTFSLPSSVTIGGTMTASTFVGSLTGAASLNVLKSGDTMTGSLTSTSFIPSSSTIPTNGLFLPAANTVGLSTSSTERMRIDSSGNVGIKTSSPSQKLQVGSASDTGSQYVRFSADKSDIYIGQSSGTLFGLPSNAFGTIFQDATVAYPLAVGTLGAQPLVFGTNNLEQMRITGTGNVGIGRTPATILDIQSSTQGAVRVRGGTGTAEGSAFYGTSGSDSTRFAIGQSAALISGTPTDDCMIWTPGPTMFYNNGAERMRVLANGNVLIGTTTDVGVKLNVNGGLKAIGISSWNGAGNGFISLSTGGATNTGYVEFMAANGNRQGYIGYSDTTVSGDAGTIPYVAGVHDFRGPIINNSGVQVTLNSVAAAPFYTLKNVGPGSSHTDVYYTGYIASQGYRDIYPSGATIAAIGFLRSPSAGGLASYGTIQFRASGNGEANFISCPVVATLTADGNFTAVGDITAYSDASLKDNIITIEDGLAKVLKLRGVSYTRNDKEDKEKKHIGLIAQEVKEVLPEVVSINDDGMHSVNYGAMVGLLIEAIKDLKSEVDNLKLQLAARI